MQLLVHYAQVDNFICERAQTVSSVLSAAQCCYKWHPLSEMSANVSVL